MRNKALMASCILLSSLIFAKPTQAAKPSTLPTAIVVQGKPTQYSEGTLSPQTMLQIRSKYLPKDSFKLINIQLNFSAPYILKGIECALVNSGDVANSNISAALLLGQFNFYQSYTDDEKSVPPPTLNVKLISGIVRGSGTDLSVICRPLAFDERRPRNNQATVIAKAELIALGKVTFVNE